jgi:NAD(P)H-dependent FMN reductase
MNTSPLRIAVIIGSTRPNRFSEQPGHWIFKEVQKLEGVEAELLDLRDHPLPMFDQPQSPSGVHDGNYGNTVVNEWAKKIGWADAFVIVSPEYNHGTSGVLKNALDSVYAEWNNKAVGFVSYGSVGGARAVEQLRLIAIELQMAPVRTAVHIPGSVVWGSGWNDEAEASSQKSADTMLDQLVHWGRAMKTMRQEG